MTLRHLRIYIMVYREMSITKAAGKLHLAQPSVSLAIKELEEHYHVKLFDRINRRLYVTDSGRRFYDYANHIVESFDRMEEEIMLPEYGGELTIGSSITIGNCVLPEVISRFHEAYPNCDAKVVIQNSKKIIRGVQKNELDIGIVEDKIQNEQIEEIPFMSDRLFFVCGRKHPLAEKKKVSLKEVCSYPLYFREEGSASREISEGFLKTQQMKYQIMWESVSNQALLHAIQKNPGITVLSGKLIERERKEGSIVILPFYPKEFLRNFSIIYHRNKYLSDIQKYIIELIQNNLWEKDILQE